MTDLELVLFRREAEGVEIIKQNVKKINAVDLQDQCSSLQGGSHLKIKDDS